MKRLLAGDEPISARTRTPTARASSSSRGWRSHGQEAIELYREARGVLLPALPPCRPALGGQPPGYASEKLTMRASGRNPRWPARLPSASVRRATGPESPISMEEIVEKRLPRGGEPRRGRGASCATSPPQLGVGHLMLLLQFGNMDRRELTAPQHGALCQARAAPARRPLRRRVGETVGGPRHCPRQSIATESRGHGRVSSTLGATAARTPGWTVSAAASSELGDGAASRVPGRAHARSAALAGCSWTRLAVSPSRHRSLAAGLLRL